jgi:hypothetical protein
MTVVVGTDEAGFGPNLGPLVVAATVWEVAAEAAAAEAAMMAAVAEAAAPWADSKRIYRGGDGFPELEAGALVGLALATGSRPSSWTTLAAPCGLDLAATGSEAAAMLAGLSLPLEADPTAIAATAARIGPRLAARGVRLVAVRCRAISPGEFNVLLDGGRNKSDILSEATLDLAAGVLPEAQAPAGETLVWCDRHGGRKRYAAAVTRHLTGGDVGPLVQVIEETQTRSTYVVPGRRCRVEFCVGGEARPPVALASMMAKYVRELGMLAFNRFWSGRVPGLTPTAGYPVDAGRWWRDAAAAIAATGLPRDAVWRRV